MTENPFSDSVPTHFAIAATVYTMPLNELEAETKTARAKLLFVVGTYGNGKSHALERLKNGINVGEKNKLSVYTSAFASKSLNKIYETICSELLAGKISKLENSAGAKSKMLSKGIPEKIVNMLFEKTFLKEPELLKQEMQFGKIISASSDIINFICGISALTEQFVLLIDDIEEATTLDKNERKMFFGNIRALYDQAVRNNLNLIIVLALTPEKLGLLKEDRQDLYERVDRLIHFEKPSLKEVSEIVQKRLEISGLSHFIVSPDALKKIWMCCSSIREIFNILRDLFKDATEKNISSITQFEAPEKLRAKIIRGFTGYKPADESILKSLSEKDGLRVQEIVSATKMSATWVQHRLAELVKKNVLRKEQRGRNTPAKYYIETSKGAVR